MIFKPNQKVRLGPLHLLHCRTGYLEFGGKCLRTSLNVFFGTWDSGSMKILLLTQVGMVGPNSPKLDLAQGRKMMNFPVSIR